MNIQEQLKRIKEYDAKVNAMRDEIIRLEAAMGVQGVKYDSDVVVHGDDDKLQHKVIKLIELKDKLDAQIEEYMQYRFDMLNVIKSLRNVNQFNVIYKRYFEFKAFHRIAKEMHYSEMQVFRLHSDAIEYLVSKC